MNIILSKRFDDRKPCPKSRKWWMLILIIGSPIVAGGRQRPLSRSQGVVRLRRRRQRVRIKARGKRVSARVRRRQRRRCDGFAGVLPLSSVRTAVPTSSASTHRRPDTVDRLVEMILVRSTRCPLRQRLQGGKTEDAAEVAETPSGDE